MNTARESERNYRVPEAAPSAAMLWASAVLCSGRVNPDCARRGLCILNSGALLPLGLDEDGFWRTLDCAVPENIREEDITGLFVAHWRGEVVCGPPAVGDFRAQSGGDLILAADWQAWMVRWLDRMERLRQGHAVGPEAYETLVLDVGAFEWRVGFLDSVIDSAVKRIVVRDDEKLAEAIVAAMKRPRAASPPVVFAKRKSARGDAAVSSSAASAPPRETAGVAA